MKENKSVQLKRSIQKKLMAATSMLMVAVIMMVSSTYAWFTLSTAPEVTGITTAVGANGNLEIALATGETWADPSKISSAVGKSGENTAWGNLVDVSDDDMYGLNKITLMPAELNVNDAGKVVGSYLKTPLYGSDGRVDSLTANTTTGVFNTQDQKFYVNDTEFGVRAVGTASAMTPRQSAYRNAKATLTSAGTMTKTYASRSLYENGNSLASIIMKHVTAGADESYTQTDLAAINNMLAGLTLSLGQAKDALDNAVKGVAASNAAVTAGVTDEMYTTIEGSLSVASIDTTNSNIVVNGVTVPVEGALLEAAKVYNRAAANLESAKTAAAGLAEKESMTWSEISAVLTLIVNPTDVKVNGIASGEVKDHISEIASGALSGTGIQVQLPSGSGIYADVAELAGNYETSVLIAEMSYGGFTASNLPAKMVTTVEVGPYFTGAATQITLLGAPAAGNATANTEVTDFYGYAVDMIFRTNAAESDLLLRTTPVDRVYDENTMNEETMGGGSTMSFTSGSLGFSADQVAALMSAIRVLFLDDEGTILANARLDMGVTKDAEGNITARNYDVNGDEVVADLLIWNDAVESAPVEATVTTTATEADLASYTNSETATEKVTYTKTLNADGTTYTVTSSTITITPGSFADADTGVITELAQNTAKNITVLVYLDGNYVDNSMVASAGQSMTGSMNLQFASSAELVPMENTALRQGTGESSTPAATAAPEATAAPVTP